MKLLLCLILIQPVEAGISERIQEEQMSQRTALSLPPINFEKEYFKFKRGNVVKGNRLFNSFAGWVGYDGAELDIKYRTIPYPTDIVNEGPPTYHVRTVKPFWAKFFNPFTLGLLMLSYGLTSYVMDWIMLLRLGTLGLWAVCLYYFQRMVRG